MWYYNIIDEYDDDDDDDGNDNNNYKLQNLHFFLNDKILK